MAPRVYARYIGTFILLVRRLAKYLVEYMAEIKAVFPPQYHQLIDDLLEILNSLVVAADAISSDPTN